ncbi:MAG: allantoinase AllB, partial [Anaerolineales bacterium]|nr:allantoinase AllB [Anaerolineales bacterium]
IPAARVLNVGGKALLPGLVDGHVHFNEPGRGHWEGYRSGTMAAAAGGITTVLEMPLNASPPTIHFSGLEMKRQAVRGEAVVDYGFWGGLVDNNLADLDALNAEGVIGFKGFMSHSGIDEFKRIDDDILYAGLECAKDLGNLIGLHAENEDVTRYLGERLRSTGRTDRASWAEARPPASELEAIQRACTWAAETGGNLHIVHITIPTGIRAVWEARQKGAKVTSETCPHYLFFDQQDFERIGPAAKCAPPIRTRQTVNELWECVLLGLVDVIGSDHSPCTWAEKEPGLEDIWKAWGGISGIQTMLPVILTAGVHQRGLALPDLVRMMAANPARIFGLYPTKGALKPGSDADFTVVDLEREWVLSAQDLFYKNKHSAYVETTFKGRVEQTYVRGKLVYQDGKILAEPGYGKALRRQTPYSFE